MSGFSTPLPSCQVAEGLHWRRLITATVLTTTPSLTSRVRPSHQSGMDPVDTVVLALEAHRSGPLPVSPGYPYLQEADWRVGTHLSMVRVHAL